MSVGGGVSRSKRGPSNSPSPQALVTVVAGPPPQSCSHMKKLELREVKQLAHRHTARKWPSWDSNVKRDRWAPKPMFFSLFCLSHSENKPRGWTPRRK